MRRPAGGWTLAIGLALLVVAQLAGSVLVMPLYDGIVVEDPYRYLSPPAGQPGQPTSASFSNPLDAGASPQVFAATLENPPQAQLIADRGAFVVSPTATAVNAVATPVPPAAMPDQGQLEGNVYRLSVTDQAGTVLRVRAGSTVTLVLRSPLAFPQAQIARYTGSAWQLLPTISGGLPDLYAANITELGDFAVVAPPGATPLPSGAGLPSATGSQVPVNPGSGSGLNATLFAVIGIILGVALLAAWELWQRRRSLPPPPARPRRR